MQTPTSPVNLAWAQAMNAAISSWRAWMKRGRSVPASPRIAPRKPMIPSPA